MLHYSTFLLLNICWDVKSNITAFNFDTKLYQVKFINVNSISVRLVCGFMLNYAAFSTANSKWKVGFSITVLESKTILS